MKCICLLVLCGFLVSCEERVSLVEVYDGVVTHSENGEVVTTGAKFITFEDVGGYSRLSVRSVEGGAVREVGAHELTLEELVEAKFMIRFYPYHEGRNHWDVRFVSSNGSGPVVGAELPAGGWVSSANRSRFGRLKLESEVIDCFLISREGASLDGGAGEKFSGCRSLEDYVGFSEQYSGFEVVVLMLE